MNNARDKAVVGRHCVSANSADPCRPPLRGDACRAAQQHLNADSQSRPTVHKLNRLRRLEMIYGSARPLFFLTICTVNRTRLLDNPGAHEKFMAFCAKSPELAQVWVGRYVLMPDHIHAFVSAEDSSSLSRWVGSLKKFLAAHWCSQGKHAPFWQESFFDHALRGGESYGDKWEYVRQNPIRASLVTDAAVWPFAGEIHHLEWEGDQ